MKIEWRLDAFVDRIEEFRRKIVMGETLDADDTIVLLAILAVLPNLVMAVAKLDELDDD